MDYDFKSQIITSLKKNNSTIAKSKRLFQEEHLTDIVNQAITFECINTWPVVFGAKFSHNQKNNSEEALDESVWEGHLSEIVNRVVHLAKLASCQMTQCYIGLPRPVPRWWTVICSEVQMKAQRSPR